MPLCVLLSKKRSAQGMQPSSQSSSALLCALEASRRCWFGTPVLCAVVLALEGSLRGKTDTGWRQMPMTTMSSVPSPPGGREGLECPLDGPSGRWACSPVLSPRPFLTFSFVTAKASLCGFLTT